MADEFDHLGPVCHDVLFDSQDPRVTDLEITTVAPGKVSVVFTDPQSNEKTRIDFNYKKAISGKGSNPVLQPGDLIVVP